MKTSCIQHPAREPMIIIRQWQVEACGGDTCAAALLSFFEYWHNVKLDHAAKAREANDVAEKHGESGRQDESLWQFHTLSQLKEGIVRLYAESKIASAIKILQQKGYITLGRNPNPRYCFDKTNFFLFHSEIVQADVPKSRVPSRENTPRCLESTSAIPETTTEITTETLKKDSKERKRVTKVTPEFIEKMHHKFPALSDINDRIEEALSYSSVKKWTDIQAYVRGWLRREAERNGGNNAVHRRDTASVPRQTVVYTPKDRTLGK